MPKIRKLWRVPPPNDLLKNELGSCLGVSGSIAQVLINRGITEQDIANEFLFGGQEKLGNPCLLKDMDSAVARIRKAIDDKQKIIVYGDYDVDGMTSSALMVKVITDLGGMIDYYIPDRQTEGYGLNRAALDLLSESGTELLITVDCGISAALEVSNLNGQMDIIITDHHQPPEILPAAYAIINPKQKDCQYPNKDLAGVGVAFKLCQALWQHYGDETVFLKYMDIVAVGTVADIVSLTGENRILVKLGLSEIANTKNIGLQALMEVCGIDKEQIDTGKIGFGIAPRLNAAGRLSSANHGVELLITQDKERAFQLAVQLNEENSQRQVVEKAIQAAAENFVSEIDVKAAKVLVVVGENWHSGVIGIVASRLVDKYYRPIIIISIQDGIGKASCRSIPAFDIYAALHQCSDLLIQFGGHRQAAGLSILPEHIEKLQVRLSDIADRCLTEKDFLPVLAIDTIVSLDDMNADFLKQLKCLEPYGMGNPSPVFACEDLVLKDVRTLGQEAQHLKLKVSQGDSMKEVVAWRMGELADSLQSGSHIDVAFVPETNEWQGRCTIQLRAYDVRTAEMTELDHLYTLQKSRPDFQISHDDCFARGNHQSLHHNLENNKNLIIQDARGIEDKITYILDILKHQEKTLIVVNTGREAYDLANKIRLCLPHMKEQIGFYYAGLHTEWQTKVEKWFEKDILKVVITTNAFSEQCYIKDIRHVILYSLPFNLRSLARLCSLAGGDGKLSTVHLLFNDQDIEANHVLLKEIRPERIMVGHVYLVLKKARGVISEVQVAAQVQHSYQAAISQYSVHIAVQILEDLKLVGHEIIGLSKRICVLPAPQEKLDIEQSVTFRQGMMEKNEFIEFAAGIMGSSVSQLLSQMIMLLYK